MNARTNNLGRGAAIVAMCLGLGHAAVSAYWALGGTVLLSTVGGDLERWGRERRPELIIALWLVVVLKSVVAVAAPVLAGLGERRLPDWTTARAPRVLGWIAAVTLVLYGGVLTIVGLVVQAGLVETPAGSNERALQWHSYLWDPWFLVWGIAFMVSLRATRPRSSVPAKSASMVSPSMTRTTVALPAMTGEFVVFGVVGSDPERPPDPHATASTTGRPQLHL